MHPHFWGIEEEKPAEMLRQLADSAGLSEVKRREAFPSAKVRTWSSASRSGLLDSSLSNGALRTQTLKEEWEERHGLKIDQDQQASTLRPVVATGALTPAAARMLGRGPNGERLAATRTSWVGGSSLHSGGEGMMRLVVDDKSESMKGWKALFKHGGASHEGSQHFKPLREDRVSGAFLKKSHQRRRGGQRSKSVNDAAPEDSAAAASSSPEPRRDAGSSKGPDTSALARRARELAAQEDWGELAALLCNLRVIRGALMDGGAAQLIHTLTDGCTALEAALTRARGVAVDERDTGERKEQMLRPHCVPIGTALDRVRQHRRLLLQHAAELQVRPQAVLLQALLVHAELPAVAHNAVDMVKHGEHSVQKLALGLRDLRERPVHLPSACEMLAAIKAALREVWMDGTVESALCAKQTAAQFRLLSARVGLRLLETREAIAARGVALEAHVLEELLRTDEGQFPSVDDKAVAREACKVAHAALAALDLEQQQRRVERREREKRDREARRPPAARPRATRCLQVLGPRGLCCSVAMLLRCNAASLLRIPIALRHFALSARGRRAQVEAASKGEELELQRIADSERKREFLRRADRTRCERIMGQALTTQLWEYEMPPGLGGNAGGCIAVDGARIFAACDSPLIKARPPAHPPAMQLSAPTPCPSLEP